MRKIYLCILFTVILQVAYGQHYDFSHINNAHGLSNNQVVQIFKDSKGFMWFATNTGLNRYDGINFKEFNNIKSDSQSTPYDRYTQIQEDSFAQLWFTVEDVGFAIYDLKTEAFIRNVDSVLVSIGLLPNPILIDIDNQKNIYAYYQDKGICKYNAKTNECTTYKLETGTSNISSGEIIRLKTNANYIWVLFSDGLIERYNQQTNTVDVREPFYKNNQANSTIKKSLFIDKDDDLWVYPSTHDKAAAYFDVQKKRWAQLEENIFYKSSNNLIGQIAQDAEGLLWIASDHGGINVFDKKSKKITVLQNDIHNKKSISQNSAISIYCDNEGIMWIGTYKNGISYYHPKIYKFESNEVNQYFEKNNEAIDCNSLYKDNANNLWIGTNGGGLIQYNDKSNKVTVHRHNPQDKQSISANIITSIYQDHNQNLWIGTFLGGLNAFANGKFKQYQVDESSSNSLSNKSIYGMQEDTHHNLWIGTLGGGVDKLDPTRQIFTHHNIQNTPALNSNYILSMHKSSGNDIYLSTDRGINIIDAQNSKITQLGTSSFNDSLASPLSNNVIIDSRNLTWIGTNKGLNVYNPKTNKLQWITSAEGLPSDEVVSLIEDDDGNIWAGTRNGLAYIFCSLVDDHLQYYISYFDTKDGLPSSVCNQNAIYKDQQGTIYVGCTSGYVSFHPKDILQLMGARDPQPLFTELTIGTQSIKPNTQYNGRIILDKSINLLNEITLTHKETNFALSFSAFNYIHPEKTSYKYMLKGLDNDWTETKDGIGTAAYSNLSPGTYQLLVYASNGSNVWSQIPLEMTIVVRPPLWASWWALLVYISLIILALRYFMNWRLNKQKHEFQQVQKIQEADRLHEVDELKIKFFTNISHEFKTPLTLIITPLEKMLKNTQSEQHGMLNIVYRNAQQLLLMVNEILDFRKLDLGKMTINYYTGNIVAFLRDICQSFSGLANEKSIKLTFTTFVDELFMEFDSDYINKIVANLLSNAFKFTESGQINLSLGIQEDFQNSNNNKTLSIKISDTGIGIKKELLPQIFDRFYRVENPSHSQVSGTGIGLHLANEYARLHGGSITVESEVNKGSIFTVLLPIQFASPHDKVGSSTVEVFSETDENESTIDGDKSNLNKKNLPLLLIVDDNEDFCSFIKKLFSEEYRVETAYDGEEATHIVLDLLPDIILSDVSMPKMDGYEFCKKIKEDIRTSHIPIILLTAKSSDEHKFKGIEAGADDYISKPFNIDMLTLKIEKIVEKQRRIQHNFNQKIEINPTKIEIRTMDEKFIEKAIAIVEENIDNTEFLVEDLCKEMAMSRVYFYKKILALTDKSPSEFIRFIRLKRAADLLEKSQMFVNEVAFEVGFNDPKYFRKHFKEEFGVTPSEYKKNTSEEK